MCCSKLSKTVRRICWFPTSQNKGLKQARPIEKSCSPIEISTSHQGASIGTPCVSAQAVAEQHKAAELDQRQHLIQKVGRGLVPRSNAVAVPLPIRSTPRCQGASPRGQPWVHGGALFRTWGLNKQINHPTPPYTYLCVRPASRVRSLALLVSGLELIVLGLPMRLRCCSAARESLPQAF